MKSPMTASLRVCALALGLSLVSAFAARADVTEIVARCETCHGMDGVSADSHIPTIAGFSDFVFEDYMLEYQEGERPCRDAEYPRGDLAGTTTTMCEQVKNLSEGQLSEIIAFFVDKEFEPAMQEFDSALAAEGASVHRRDCEKCHTDGGSYSGDDAGILAGQWMPYLEQAFSDFAQSKRPILEEKMAEKIKALDPMAIRALVHFYASEQ